ncbi:hypothetical protein B7463_g2532, partial [Scytalidium lignicola]
MSGRSAYVRKEKTKLKDKSHHVSIDRSASILADYPVNKSKGMPTLNDSEHHGKLYDSRPITAKSIASSGSDELAYARVRHPPLPVIDVSGIEKSSFRSIMDKRSEGIRKGLSKTFGGGKKKQAELEEVARPHSSSTGHSSHAHEVREVVEEELMSVPAVKPRTSQQQKQQQEQGRQQVPEDQSYPRSGPPQTKLPPIPQGPQLRRWIGNGRPPKPWNKLRKDPELWDPNGDTLVFLSNEAPRSARPPPSFRLSSHVLEATESRVLITMLREGTIDDGNGFNMPPSPVGSPTTKSSLYVRPASRQQGGPTPPVSEYSAGVYDGQVSYEIFFPVPAGLTKSESLRHQVTTRNVFALLFQASLVGLNLYQALNDLHKRLEVFMPPETDIAQLLIDYIAGRGIDDVRNSPSTAAALLAWSETPGVRWEEGWRESFIHTAGMYNKFDGISEFRYITPITKALLERSSLEVQVRVNAAEDRLANFDFSDMWPLMSEKRTPAQLSFERLRKFFLQHYEYTYEIWPPHIQYGEDTWLTRSLVERLQKDFGALYDYIVNRNVVWDCSEERSGRKWNIVNPDNKGFEADSEDIPFTDILVAFDNRHKYPHIPHPYPLVPESVSMTTKPSDSNLRATSRRARTGDEKMAERKAALAYTESTNIYLLGSDFTPNDLVDAFVRFEKADKVGDVDPYAARRGRWVLIYGILQTLATVAVDTPNMRYTDDVPYHLNPKLRGTPPWKGAIPNKEEAVHEVSYCWRVPTTWSSDMHESPTTISNHSFPLPHAYRNMKSYLPSTRSSSITVVDSENGSMAMSMKKSPSSVGSRSRRGTMASATSLAGGLGGGAPPRIPRDGELLGFHLSGTGYAPGIEKVDEYDFDWPMKEESRENSRTPNSRRDDSRSRSDMESGLAIERGRDRDKGRESQSARDSSRDGQDELAGVGSSAVELLIKDFDEFDF